MNRIPFHNNGIRKIIINSLFFSIEKNDLFNAFTQSEFFCIKLHCIQLQKMFQSIFQHAVKFDQNETGLSCIDFFVDILQMITIRRYNRFIAIRIIIDNVSLKTQLIK